MEYKYDVFISYSRKDYVDEQKNVIPDNVISIIKDKLIENNISYWMDEEGNLTGKKFAHIIAGKIRESMIFIFVCSKNSVSSRWVDRELSVADTLNKHIIPFVCDDSFLDDKVVMYTSSLDRIEYNTNPHKELSKLITTIKKEKKRHEYINSTAIVEKEIKDCADEVKILMAKKQVLLASIYKKLRTIDVANKECPVCKSKCELETEYCQTCGWYFHPLSNIVGLEEENNKSAITLARIQWENSHCASETAVAEIQKENVELRKSNEDLTAKVDVLNKQEEVSLKIIEELKQEVNELKELPSEVGLLNSFKSNFSKHNILTAMMLCIAIIGLGLLGLVLYGDNLDGFSKRYFIFMLFLFYMSYSNYQLFKFKKWIWGASPILSFFIGLSYNMNLALATFFLCIMDLGFFALLFFLKNNGKNSYSYIRS